jgi:hypothetical protein
MLGCFSALPIAYLALWLVDARVNQPLMLSRKAAVAEALGSIALYATFALLSSLRATQIQPVVALRSELSDLLLFADSENERKGLNTRFPKFYQIRAADSCHGTISVFIIRSTCFERLQIAFSVGKCLRVPSRRVKGPCQMIFNLW